MGDAPASERHQLLCAAGGGRVLVRAESSVISGHTMQRTLRDSKWTMNMQCERLLAMFMGVSQMVRFVSPRNSCEAAARTLSTRVMLSAASEHHQDTAHQQVIRLRVTVSTLTDGIAQLCLWRRTDNVQRAGKSRYD